MYIFNEMIKIMNNKLASPLTKSKNEKSQHSRKSASRKEYGNRAPEWRCALVCVCVCVFVLSHRHMSTLALYSASHLVQKYSWRRR